MMMGRGQDITPAFPRELRKYRRFPLHYPVSVKFGRKRSCSELQTVSQNMSVRGILVQSDSPIPAKAEVRFVITVRENYITRPIQLAGEGAVVRVEPNRSGAGFLIAVKCKRSISEVGSFSKAYLRKA
jgi:hypothetical protein